MIIVSDTSPITCLLTIGRINLLKDLFSSVLIPPAVDGELRAYHNAIPTFIEVGGIENMERAEQLENSLDRGEAEAIVLAHERNADLLLMDEKIGRTIATGEGIKVIGLMGVLFLAKEKGFLSSVTETIRQLENDAGFYLSDDVREIVLRRAAELDEL